MNELEYQIDQITVGKRRRSLGDVSALATSISEIGLLNPIHILPDGTLVAGYHRLEAFKMLGRQSIPVRIVEYDELDAELAEIDENLRRNDLTVLEQADHLLRRNEILEAKGQRAESGTNIKNGGTGVTVTPVQTTADIAAEMGISENSAQKRLQIARNLTEATKEILADTEIADSTTKLLRLARIEDPADQRWEAARLVRELDEEDRLDKITMPHVSHNSGNNEWYTPSEYIDAARKVMGEIDLDPATSNKANEVVNADAIYTAEDDGLAYSWAGRVWMNPPYASDLIGKFADKLARHFENGDVTEAIVLVNNATETAWFQTLVRRGSAVVFPGRRVRFWKDNGETGGPLQGQAIIYLGQKPNAFKAAFAQFGWSATL